MVFCRHYGVRRPRPLHTCINVMWISGARDEIDDGARRCTTFKICASAELLWIATTTRRLHASQLPENYWHHVGRVPA